MSSAFVDTTVLTDALLKPGPKSDAARAALESFNHTFLPVYAIKEFKAGPLGYFRWLYNKCVIFKSFEAVINALHGISRTPRRYLTSTAIEGLQLFASEMKSITPGRLVEKYGSDAEMDFVLSDRLRWSVRAQIDLAWEERRALTSEVVDELTCYTETPPYVDEKGLIVLKPTSCEPDGECALAQRLKAEPEALKKLHAAVPKSGRAEDVKRAQVLKDLYRIHKQPLTAEKCRSLGDAVFSFFCPRGAVILTTNVRDHKPLAESLGKTAVSPESLRGTLPKL
jgi:hypothetical protein